MDNLQDLLAKHVPQEPPEIRAIKDFVREKFDAPVGVSIQERQIVLTAGSASMASALRACTVEILQKSQTPEKRLVIRIGRS